MLSSKYSQIFEEIFLCVGPGGPEHEGTHPDLQCNEVRRGSKNSHKTKYLLKTKTLKKLVLIQTVLLWLRSVSVSDNSHQLPPHHSS